MPPNYLYLVFRLHTHSSACVRAYSTDGIVVWGYRHLFYGRRSLMLYLHHLHDICAVLHCSWVDHIIITTYDENIIYIKAYNDITFFYVFNINTFVTLINFKSIWHYCIVVCMHLLHYPSIACTFSMLSLVWYVPILFMWKHGYDIMCTHQVLRVTTPFPC